MGVTVIKREVEPWMPEKQDNLAPHLGGLRGTAGASTRKSCDFRIRRQSIG
jgi:hypothetical protein